ncbi:MAG: pro-sigmaK processing inhibitor BofA family protein [Clostridia bacterium]|nr:pro-sigmaK processing inhibitor BofA family protein [Clostridia bacterium]
MTNHLLILTALSILVFLFIIHLIIKSPRPILKALGSPISGILGLGFLNFINNFTGLSVPLNLMSITTASVLGIPGVGLMTILNSMFS